MSYRKPNTSIAFFNPTGEIISGISKARKGIADRFKTVEDFENAASIRNQELQDSLNETETMEDMDALNLLQSQISDELDELYKLDIQTFEGDRSAYNKKKSEIEKIIGNVPALMAAINDEGQKLKETQNTGNFTKQLLRSNNEDYYKFVQDASSGGKNISFRVKNGNIIAQLNGKDVFNGTAFVKAKKDGFDLVNYAGDYSKEIDETIKQNAVGLQGLVSSKITEKINDGTISKTELKNYSRAKQIFEQRLRESPNLGALVNESTYQLFTGYGLGKDSDNMDAWTGDDMQKAAAKEALIKYMIDRQFPEDKFITKYTEEVEKPMNEYQRKSLALQREKLQLAKDKKQKTITRLPFIKAKKAIEDFETKKLRSGKTTKELVKEFYDRNLKKAEEDTKKITDDEGNTLSPKERVDVFLEESDAWKKLTNPITSTFDDYLGKDVDIGGKKYQISDFTLGVDDDGDFVVIPTYLDIEGKPAEFTQSIQYKLNKSGIEALNDDLLQAGSEQFTRPDPITLPSNSEYQASLTNAKSGDIITKPDGTKVEVLKQNGKTYIKNI
tara:strand:+ start:7313 stop:8983 length:1671 start_codon:yes stop_codon:yes gene_type:complete